MPRRRPLNKLVSATRRARRTSTGSARGPKTVDTLVKRAVAARIGRGR